MDKKLYQVMDWPEIEAVVYSEENKPHNILGAHKIKQGILIQAFFPDAENVWVIVQETKKKYSMERVDEDGFFAVLIPGRTIPSYHFLVEDLKGVQKELPDVYHFQPELPIKELKKFQAGVHEQPYRMLGAHEETREGVLGTRFAVWAPNAIRVSVVGDFNGWDGRYHQMYLHEDFGVYELFIPGVVNNMIYKYEVKVKGGAVKLKADPYGLGSEAFPDTASVITSIENYKWNDNKWLANNKKRNIKSDALNIYQVHAGSFYRSDEGEISYRELADHLAEYVSSMEYTHVEFLPVMEYTDDEFLGFKTTGYYVPDSRYGTPDDFKYLVDTLHQKGIGVILDWCVTFFPGDEHGLREFDGTCLYEHQDMRQGYYPQWKTYIYNYARPEVRNFLIGNALFWIEEYHIDGIHLEGVSPMLYLDYGKQESGWVANMYGGNENLDAVEFIKQLNTCIKEKHPEVMVSAQDSSLWPMVTAPVAEGGLGFDFKRNQCWLSDFVKFIQQDPMFRSHRYGDLIFSMIYAYSEQFMLPFSYSMFANGKPSLYERMPGDESQKLSGVKAAFGYMMTHPGKKLNFMGQEFAQEEKWDFHGEISKEDMTKDGHKGVLQYIKDLNKLYKKEPALHKLDYQTEGFEWINNISANENIIVFLRKTEKKEDTLLVICNFSGLSYDNYKIGVPYAGKYKEILNSDHVGFDGSGFTNPRVKQAKEDECDDRVYSLRIRVPALGVSIFKYMGSVTEEKKTTTKKVSVKEKLEAQIAKAQEQPNVEKEVRAARSVAEASLNRKKKTR